VIVNKLIPKKELTMKSRIAAALSLSGVLVAGSAAALVNTQVLNDSNRAAAAAPASIVAITPAASVANAEPAATVVVEAAPATATPTIQAGNAPSSQAVYQIGDSGFATLDTVGDVLTVVSASPNTGWSVTQAENSSPLQVEITFQTGSTTVQFKADLLFGVVSTSVERTDASTSGSTGSITPSANNGQPSEGGSDDHEKESDD
jgi:hypothetical protein